MRIKARSFGGSFHSALPLSVFFIGGSLIYAGGNAHGSLSSYLLAALISAILLFAVLPAALSTFSSPSAGAVTSIPKRLTLIFLSSLSVIISLKLALSVTEEFSDFAGEVMFIRLPYGLVSLLFLTFCAFFASKGAAVVKKLSRYVFFLLLGGSVLLLIYSIPSMDMRLWDLSLGVPQLTEAARISLREFLPMAIPLLLLCTRGPRQRVSTLSPILGVALGISILLICHFNTVLIFGESLADTLPRPYPEAVSTITAGKLFLRLEGLFYAMYFAAAAFRCAACIALTAALIRKLLPKLPQGLLCALSALAVYLLSYTLP